MTGRSSELEAKEGGDGEHVGALEAIMGEADVGTIVEAEGAAADEFGADAMLMRFEVLEVTSLVVADAIGMTRVMGLLEIGEFTATAALGVDCEAVFVEDAVPELVEDKGRKAIIFFPPGPVMTIS